MDCNLIYDYNIVLFNQTRSIASGNSSLKWTDLSKLWKRRATPSRGAGLEAFPVPDQIVLDAQEIIAHHHTSIRPLKRYSYMGASIHCILMCSVS